MNGGGRLQGMGYRVQVTGDRLQGTGGRAENAEREVRSGKSGAGEETGNRGQWVLQERRPWRSPNRRRRVRSALPVPRSALHPSSFILHPFPLILHPSHSSFILSVSSATMKPCFQ